MKKYNVAIVGYGWVAGAHITAINATSLAQVTAVCSRRELDPVELRAKHGSPITVYHDLRQLLANPDIHAVSICSYPWEHTAQLVAAARAGKHLIIEKPLALQLRDIRAMQQAVAKARVRTCVCFECRYASQFLATKAILGAGLLGRVHYGEVDYYHGIGPWYAQYRWAIKKSGGGSSLLEAGCHAMDAMLLCMGTDVESVFSSACYSAHKDFRKYEFPTTSVTLLQYRDGRTAKVTSCIDCLQPYYFHTHLVGSAGSLLDNKIYSTKLAGLNKNKWSELAMRLVDSGDVADHPYLTQFEAFFAALDQGKEMPLTSLAESVKAHEVIFAADRSAAIGRPVKLANVIGR